MAPNVSVCIPTYNRKDYLKETLESVFAQTYEDYEIVIVDDGSTDGTEEMIQHINFPIRYYWQENTGDAAARNKLIELAQAKYITFIDSDDLLMPNALERMMEVMTREKDDVVVYGQYLRIDQNGNVYGKCKRKLRSGSVTRHLFQDIFIHSSGSIFPRRVFKDTAFDISLKVCSDYDLWLRLSLKYRFIALTNPTFKRRRHSANLSTASFENRLAELKVLGRFYYERGGHETISKITAMQRMSKEEFRAGLCALRGNDYQMACVYMAKSMRRYPNVKSLLYWINAIILKTISNIRSL